MAETLPTAPQLTNALSQSQDTGFTTAFEGQFVATGQGTGAPSDKPALAVVNGTVVMPGETIILGSGASLTVKADLSYIYDPGDAFDDLALGETGTDSFDYSLASQGSVLDGFGADDGVRFDIFLYRGYEFAVRAAGDVNGDGFADLIVTGAGDRILYGGSDLDPVTNFDDLDVLTFYPLLLENDRLNFLPSTAPFDLNGDGFDDMVFSVVGGDQGAYAVVFGKSDAFSGSIGADDLDGTNGFIVSRVSETPADREIMGPLVPAGDVNGDGFDDLVFSVARTYFGSIYDNTYHDNYVLFGSDQGYGREVGYDTLDNTTATAGRRILGGSPWIAGVGDINGDGFDDILGSNEYNTDYGGYVGKNFYLTFGSESFASEGPERTAYSSSLDYYYGSVELQQGTGDLNGDGFDDVALGINLKWGDDSLLGRSWDDDYIGTGWDGITFSAGAGRPPAPLSFIGDVNGDGIDDMLIADPRVTIGGKAYVGSAFVVYGREDGFPDNINLTDLTSDEGLRFDGNNDNDRFGRDIWAAGDVNGDGIDDLIIGAYEPTAAGDRGNYVHYLLYGRDDFSDIPGRIVSTTATVNVAVERGFGLDLSVDSSHTLAGTRFDDTLRGDRFAETLSGLGGNDRVLGGSNHDVIDGGAGNDTMIGGTGNDYYVVGLAGDRIVERAGEGRDTVLSYAEDYVLDDNVDVLKLGQGRTTATGNDDDNRIAGNRTANVLLGEGGDDRLEGLSGDDRLNGGDGDDTMLGGNGDDIYYVSAAGDQVIETAGSGIDTVIVYGAMEVTLGAHVENLTLRGGAREGNGNALANTITGSDDRGVTLNGGDGNDSLVGGDGDDRLNGERGDDTMVGGGGDDTYRVNSTGDVVVELTDAGNDLVIAYTDVTLSANVESVDLRGTASAATGNGSDNTITGNGHANMLSGLGGRDSIEGGSGDDTIDGGAGADTMLGGTGDDYYVIGLPTDDVVEMRSEGIDTVLSYVDGYTLGDHVERLEIGYGRVAGAGNSLGNRIFGNDEDNIISGLGGDDTLIGGKGQDLMSLGAGEDEVWIGAGDSGTSAATRDIITDFTRGDDLLDLSAIDADTTAAGHQAFDFVGTGAIVDAGDLGFRAYGSKVIVIGDTDGDGAVDFTIELQGLGVMASTDFIL